MPNKCLTTSEIKGGKGEEILSQILKVQQRKILLMMCLVGTPVRDVMEVRLIIAVKMGESEMPYLMSAVLFMIQYSSITCMNRMSSHLF